MADETEIVKLKTIVNLKSRQAGFRAKKRCGRGKSRVTEGRGRRKLRQERKGRQEKRGGAAMRREEKRRVRGGRTATRVERGGVGGRGSQVLRIFPLAGERRGVMGCTKPWRGAGRVSERGGNRRAGEFRSRNFSEWIGWRNARNCRAEKRACAGLRQEKGTPRESTRRSDAHPAAPFFRVRPPKIKVLGRGMGVRGKGDSPFSKGCHPSPAISSFSLPLPTFLPVWRGRP